jgi:4-aminobutyrate aminotransferase-like enzyme
MSIAEQVARRERVLGSAPLFYKEPVHIVRGEGVWLFDIDGKRYIDMYNNVPCVGHANPLVVAAMQHQMGTLNVHSRYLHEGILDYAERLLELHHDALNSIVFACSGTEASEIALQMARYGTGGRGIICTDATYHGNSTEVGKMSRISRSKPVADSDFRAIPFPQTYRPLDEGATGAELTRLYLKEVQAAIDDFASNNIPLAGMFVCSIQANEGLPDIPPGFMSQAAELIHQAGGLFMADEVQAGFCRSGDWWGYETSDFTPDIVSMGKPMGNGLPVSGVAASTELVASFRDNTRYFNTFASSPLQAAVGMAVLDAIEAENLLETSAKLGDYLRSELRNMQHKCDAIAEVRGCGLFVGLEWVSDRNKKTPDRAGAVEVANKMKQKGFLLSNAGALGNIVKIRPPLVFQKEHADLFLTAFDEMLGELQPG